MKSKTMLASLTLLLLPRLAAAAEELRVGLAVVDITPPVGYRMSGYFSERLSTGTKDPLQAKAVVFQQGSLSAALVFCDLIGISREVSGRVREEANQASGIPTENIAIAATHSHTGPLYAGALRELFHYRILKKTGEDPQEPVNYTNELISKLVAVIGQAKAAVAPVRLASGTAREERLSFNRRFHLKNGTVQF